MPLLNYTTKVPADRTIAQIQKMLAGAGARQILTEWDGFGHVSALSFAIDTTVGARRFRLPADVTAVENTLAEQQVARSYLGPEHAERVAWRILKDWLEAQLAIIESAMVTLDQVMLPYMLVDDSGSTVYSLYQRRELGAGAP